mmetsp:Transcript_13017/g.22688  ORF Transcript_13017/g.22688 Transcript_13017/m.22688 type:complete len:354 (+) Transcript_13017:92-1153(+)
MAAVPLTDLLRTAFEDHWVQDNARPIGRRQMQDVVRALDPSYSEKDLDVIFTSIDRNRSGAIEYEEYIDYVFSSEQVLDLASHELGLLQMVVEGPSQKKEHLVDDEAEMERILRESSTMAAESARKKEAEMDRILQESSVMAAEEARKQEERLRMEDERAILAALEASAAEDAAAAARKEEARQKEDEEERLFLEASLREAQAEAARRAKQQAAADEAQVLEAMKASESTVEEERERIRQRHEEEDSSDLFRAALRASCLDLGPRGISQAAKVFATGDPTIGQPKAGFDTSTSGARGRRSKAAVGAAPTYTGSESAAGKAPVAGRAGSPAALKRQAERDARTTGFRASRPGKA